MRRLRFKREFTDRPEWSFDNPLDIGGGFIRFKEIGVPRISTGLLFTATAIWTVLIMFAIAAAAFWPHLPAREQWVVGAMLFSLLGGATLVGWIAVSRRERSRQFEITPQERVIATRHTWRRCRVNIPTTQLRVELTSIVYGFGSIREVFVGAALIVHVRRLKYVLAMRPLHQLAELNALAATLPRPLADRYGFAHRTLFLDGVDRFIGGRRGLELPDQVVLAEAAAEKRQ
jgi:hypothetical protein